jgi:hypothetical protein
MRRDYIIAIILAIAAIPAGATLMVAPDYLHLTGWEVPATFWGGIGLTTALILAAAIVAWRSERKPPAPAVSPHSEAPRDVSLLDAIWRVFMGTWGDRKKFWDGGDPNGNEDWAKFYFICEDIRQVAFEGKLPLWATREDTRLSEPVPLEFWRERRLCPQPMMDPEWPDLPGINPPDVWVEYCQGPGKYHRTTEWLHFMTNKEIVDRLWPPPQEVDV